MSNLKTWPVKTYLQHGAEEIPPFEECAEVTWALENVHDSDVEYVRADVLDVAVKALRESQNALARVRDSGYEAGAIMWHEAIVKQIIANACALREIEELKVKG